MQLPLRTAAGVLRLQVDPDSSGRKLGAGLLYLVLAARCRLVRFSPRVEILALVNRVCFLPPAIAVVVIFIHLVSPLSIVPVKLDRIHRQFAVDDATAEVARIIQERGEKIPVFADSYQMTSWLRFHGLPAQQVDGATRPESLYPTSAPG